MRTVENLLFILIALLSVVGCERDLTPKEYLKKVLAETEKIETASYDILFEAWEPGDTLAGYREHRINKEYANPADTTIGSCYVMLDAKDTTKFYSAYNGKVNIEAWHEKNGVMIDNFSKRTLPFRPVQVPFFNHAKSIIRYILATSDSITLEMDEAEAYRHLKLTVHGEKQVEFFGKEYYIDNPYSHDPTSIYELWISKSDHLPYKVRREMSHSISAQTCWNVAKNKLSIKDFDAYDYIPEGYERRFYGDKQEEPKANDLVGTKVPQWTLPNGNDQPVSLSDFKSKVLLLNFTGIGCGPCHASIPFLKSLKEQFSAEELDVVSIECWKRKPVSIEMYALKNELNYTLLCGNDEIVKQFLTEGVVPYYFIVDSRRVVRHVFRGYSPDSSGKQMMDAIKQLLP